MATNSALKTLIELATIEVDEAAKRLGIAIRAGDAAKEKLEMLQQYREDYASRYQNSMSTGVTAGAYRNFQLFMDKLDAAIAGQEVIVFEAQRKVGIERSSWQEGERKRMSFNTLVNRADKAGLLRENKRDQKQTDELAARKSLDKPK